MKLSRMILKFAVFGAIVSAAAPYASGREKMVPVPAGPFIMGGHYASPRTVHLDAFEIDTFEVTAGEYRRCIKAKACREITSSDPSTSDKILRKVLKDSHPVIGIAWNDAKTYCEWAGKRLPTEAEWEKAARGPDSNLNPWGNRPFKPGDAIIQGGGWSSPPGSAPTDRSVYGVYDMAGNVSEWVQDWYSKDYFDRQPKKNPSGPHIGWRKIHRGGAFALRYDPHFRSDYLFVRGDESLKYHTIFVGFRCARSVGAAK